MKYLLLIIMCMATVVIADSSHDVYETDHPSSTSWGEVSITAGLATSYRNNSVSEDALWQIPGLLMGGDAHPPEKGVTLDEASIELEWRAPESVYAGFELSQHGDHDLEFEQAFIGIEIPIAEHARSTIQVGRMKARFSPENGSHASARLFSENNVIYDAFYGGSYLDEGARFELHYNDIIFGSEVWRGGQFPSTDVGEGGAQDVYIYWQPRMGDWQAKLGTWIFRAEADSRRDGRAEDSHEHTDTSDNVDNPIQFTGRHLIAGVHGSLTWANDTDWKLQARFEIQKVDVDGDISDATRLAQLDAQYTGGWIQSELYYRKHWLAFRYARLKLDNHVIGPASPTLIEKGGLEDIGRDPDSLAVSYGYLLHSNLRLGLEWTQNRTTNNKEEYFGIGLKWRAKLL